MSIMAVITGDHVYASNVDHLMLKDQLWLFP